MKTLSKLIKSIRAERVRIKNKCPKIINNVWYNLSVHSSKTDFPQVFDDNKKYIYCKMGLKVKMIQLKDGRFAWYEVIKIKYSSGGDWLFDSDRINCDVKFSHIN